MDDNQELADLLGIIEGHGRALSIHLFAAIADLLTERGICTRAQVADAIAAQAEAATPEIAGTLNALSDSWRGPKPPDLRIV